MGDKTISFIIGLKLLSQFKLDNFIELATEKSKSVGKQATY